MGLPLLTHTGETFASRVATSLLQTIGLPELNTQSWQAYEAKAVSLAKDPPAVELLKQQLATQIQTSTLFKTEQFARDLEDIYRQIWQAYREKNHSLQ